MKKLLILSALFLFTLVGCQKDCDQFHEGDKCETEIRNSYYGVYSGYLTQPSGVINATTTVISGGSDATKIKFGGISATLTNRNSFTIPYQVVFYGGQSATVSSGSGTITTNSISYSFIGDGAYFSFVGTR